MVWKLALFLVSAAAFAVMPFADQLGMFAGAALPLLLCMAFACAACSGFSALGAAKGALGALLSALIWPVSPWGAGAVLSAFVFAERSARVRQFKARLVHLGLALGLGAVSGALVARYGMGLFSAQGWIVGAISLVTVSVLMQLPLFIEADDAVAHALALYGGCVREPARGCLLEGAELRRSVVDVAVSGKDAREIDKAWKMLVALGEARVRLERVLVKGAARAEGKAGLVANKLDARIAEHVGVLSRMLSAADAVAVASVGLNDSALRHVESVGESLEVVSQVLADD